MATKKSTVIKVEPKKSISKPQKFTNAKITLPKCLIDSKGGKMLANIEVKVIAGNKLEMNIASADDSNVPITIPVVIKIP